MRSNTMSPQRVNNAPQPVWKFYTRVYRICSNRGLVSNRSLSRLKAGVDRPIKTIEAGLEYTPGLASYTTVSALHTPSFTDPVLRGSVENTVGASSLTNLVPGKQ